MPKRKKPSAANCRHKRKSADGDRLGFFDSSYVSRHPYNLRERKVKVEERTPPSVEEPERKRRRVQEPAQFVGEKLSSSKSTHNERKVKVEERTPPSVEEPERKRRRVQEPAQSAGVKLPSSKSTHKAELSKFYKKGQLLGSGGFGSVYAGTRISDGLPVALKYVQKDGEENVQLPGMESPMPREVGLFQAVNDKPHPNVLRLYDWFDTPSSYVMAMERPEPCMDLFTYCEEQGGAIDEDQACSFTRQLLGALQHCQDQGVVHRDVKPENVMVQTDNEAIKLIDFGCGDPLKDTPYTDFAGTPDYLPVEWFQKEQFLAGPGTVWSVGVTVYNIVTGLNAFSHHTRKEMRHGHVDFIAGLSPEIKDFIRCCVKPQPTDRPTLEQLLLHPWMQ